MEPILFYGVPHGCSFASVAALEWLGRPYKLCRIAMLEDKHAEIYLKFNSLKQTPSLLLGDGDVLNESLAILLHLSAQNPDHPMFVKQGTKMYDNLNYALAYLHTTFHSVMGGLFYKKDRTRAEQEYKRVEEIVKQSGWMVGNKISLADIYLSGTARWGKELGVFNLEQEFPYLNEYLNKLETFREIQFAHDIEEERPAISSGGFKGHVSLEDLKGVPLLRR
ncbi:glutathione S-transferase family protein [Peredibacter sp. HCB2-198]|uniref:glutathione S-transferase family protein n=1 Tax=Peredibacter sp. HCB2-198 TaxID=3383025 RepID=UPI0038B51BF8